MTLNDSEDFIFYNPYAEDLILMGILSNNNLLSYIFSEMDEKLFYLQINKIIFQNMRVLYLEQNIITTITVIYQLEKSNLNSTNEEKDKILHLSKSSFSMSLQEIHTYITILKDKYIKRSLFSLSVALNQISHSYENCETINFDQIEIKLAQVIQAQSISYLHPARDLIQPALNYMRKLDENSSMVLNVSTGFSHLDFYLNGLEKGSLIIIAGRPSMGKTALGLSMIANICRRTTKASIVIFSLEMTSGQIINRLMLIESKLPLEKLQKMQLYNTSTSRLKEFFPSLYESNLYINDNNSIQLEDIRLSIKKIQTKHQKLDLVVIDYLQLLGNSKDNRAQEIGYITRHLKSIARKFNVPIIALSQLNRNVEQRSNKKPLLADLRESGCLSQNTFIRSTVFLEKTSINKLFDYRYSILESIDIKTQRIKKVFIKQGKSHGIKHLYRIQLHNRLALEITANHKILTQGGWTRVDYLTVYDKIATLHSDMFQVTYQSLLDLKYLGKYLVWNLQVPPFTNFVANTIIVHNSIEQDADIVLLLYRENYYFLQGENNNSAEIIIAKNRNGKTGSILLEFLPEIAKFQ
uniref:replication helicase subunit n=1 Tax=Rhodospora sordida TaxID=362230 RepID=UPI001FCCF910|nr:replication helicase subunit [Rhodospora sordida]UNJ15016.1 replication helicase subunit [Rhodospora sordida]